MASETEIVIGKRRGPEYGCVVTADGTPMVIAGEPGEEALLMEKSLRSKEQYGLFLRMVRCWALMERRCHLRAVFSDLEVPGHPELGSVDLTCLPVDGEVETAKMWLVIDAGILDHFLSLTTQVDDVCHGLAGVGRPDQLRVMDKFRVSPTIGIQLGLSEFIGLFHEQIEALEDMLTQQEEKARK